jgi:hypothetical protein
MTSLGEKTGFLSSMNKSKARREDYHIHWVAALRIIASPGSGSMASQVLSGPVLTEIDTGPEGRVA